VSDIVLLHDCPQNSDEWFAVRRGIPTASQFATVLAKGKGGGESITRRKYLLTLAAQVITGEKVPTWEGNEHTERGHAMEDEARQFYAFQTDSDPQPVGFMRRGRAGASPDSTVGDNGLLEIKTKLPHLQIELLEGERRLPPEHVAQAQGQLWISGRDFCDFVSYWPKLPLFVFRAERDEAYIAKLAQAVADFNGELDVIVAKYSPAERIAA
jgi:hypothetical protein